MSMHNLFDGSNAHQIGVTDWYEPDQQPTQEGLYEIWVLGTGVLANWDGEEFVLSSENHLLHITEVRWRGLNADLATRQNAEQHRKDNL